CLICWVIEQNKNSTRGIRQQNTVIPTVTLTIPSISTGLIFLQNITGEFQKIHSSGFLHLPFIVNGMLQVRFRTGQYQRESSVSMVHSIRMKGAQPPELISMSRH